MLAPAETCAGDKGAAGRSERHGAGVDRLAHEEAMRTKFRLPPEEEDALHAEARAYGISVSAYLRILAIQDREAQQRAELRAKCYPD
jgi:Mobilization protein NikA